MKIFFLFWTLIFSTMVSHAQNAPVDANKLKNLILQDVRQQGLDKSADVRKAVQTAQEAIWVKAWEQSALKSHPVTQPQRDAAYSELIALLGTTEYRFLHVAAKTQDQAKVVIENMRLNTAWDQLDFKGLGTGDSGLKTQKTDWVNMTMLMPEFRPIVKNLKVGETNATPVKAQDLWHVIGLLETRPLVSPTFDQIRPNVEKLAEQKIIGEKIKTLLNKK
jgi:peptidyl-prolyl cis-trans isomerase C